MRLPKEAEILTASAVVVAAPRYMGAFAAALGVDLLAYWPWFATVEILSGAAMALLEGWAVAFVFARWRLMRPNSKQWRVLLVLLIVLLLALPATATPYLVASQLKQPASELMPLALVVAWSFLVAAIAPLVVAAVGFADAQPASISKPKAAIEQEPVFSCECGREFPSQKGLNGHQAFCPLRTVSTNGHKEKVAQ